MADSTALDLAPILARADAATEGPWRRDGNHPAKIRGADGDTIARIVYESNADGFNTQCEADATFIAHARTDIPALVSEITRLRTALAHAITIGCAAVADALREGEEARREAAVAVDAFHRCRIERDTARSRLAHIIAALRVAPSRDVPGDPTAALLVSHIEADRRDLERAGDEMLRLTRERDEARARVKALESAPTFADGVRAGLGAALEVVYTATGAADNRLRANGGRVGADVCDELRVVAGSIEEIDPSTVKPSVG